MIYFKRDWQDHPSAVPQLNTDNRSWVRLAVLYRDHFHVDNYLFHLSLLDPDLMGVDPYDPHLNEIQKLKIINECKKNPWYFYREVLRIPAKAGSGSNQFRADRGTIATLWCYHNHIDTTNIQLRQTGKTIKIEAVAIWLLAIGAENTSILYGTIDNSKQEDCVRSIKSKLNLLPDYIYSPMKGKDFDNRGAVSNYRLNNYIKFAIGQKDKRVANSAGRGYALANKIWDEVAETINSHVSIPAASGASNAVVDEARLKGEPYGTMFACTAGTLDRPEGEFYYNLAMSGMPWNEILYDSVDWNDLKETVGLASRDKRAPLVDITMSYRQLGIAEERFQEIVAIATRDANGDMDRVKRECYSIWSRGGVGNPLSKDQLNVIFESECSPIEVEKSPQKIMVRWYKTKAEVSALIEGRKLGIGIDTSQGVARDACSVTLIDMSSMEIVGRSDISSVNLVTYADFVGYLLVMLKSPLIVIENKASGQGIIDACIIRLHNMGIDPMTVLYNNIYQNPDKYPAQYTLLMNTPMRKRNIEWYNQFKKYIGFSTTSGLRQTLYDTVLKEAVRLSASRIKDATLSNQLRNLVEKNGRVDHADDNHDDAVMSWLFICWFCIYGRNFKRYGIDPQMIMSQTIRTESGKFTDEEYEKQQEINYLNQLLQPLTEEYQLHYDTFYGAGIKSRIERIYIEMEKVGGELPKNMDTYFQDLRETKK